MPHPLPKKNKKNPSVGGEQREKGGNMETKEMETKVKTKNSEKFSWGG